MIAISWIAQAILASLIIVVVWISIQIVLRRIELVVTAMLREEPITIAIILIEGLISALVETIALILLTGRV